jgi:cytochrome c-type biogenesis protein CcmE
VKGTAIQLSFTLDAQGQQVDVNYTGTVDGTSMKGAVSMAGGQLSRTFTGTKK